MHSTIETEAREFLEGFAPKHIHPPFEDITNIELGISFSAAERFEMAIVPGSIGKNKGLWTLTKLFNPSETSHEFLMAEPISFTQLEVRDILRRK